MIRLIRIGLYVCMYVYLLAMISIIKDYIQYNHENIQIRINKCGVHNDRLYISDTDTDIGYFHKTLNI